MEYQLIFQFQSEDAQDFDQLIAIEGLLLKRPPSNSEVDGHDFGSVEFNIFLLTVEAFRSAMETIRQSGCLQEFKAAYRKVGHDSFVILWPLMLQEFKVS